MAKNSARIITIISFIRNNAIFGSYRFKM